MDAALVVIGVLTGLVLLLLVPVDVAFRLHGIEAFNGQITIRWLFGLARFRIRVPGLPEPPQPETATQAVKRRRNREKPRLGVNVIRALRQAAFRRRVYRLVNDLVAAVHPYQVRLRMRLGLGDPAETGRLWVFMGPLSAAAANLRNAKVQIEPDFLDCVLEFQASGRFLLIPFQFLVLAVGFAFSPASIRAWRALKGGHA